jgi:hypothetical protein
LAEDRFLQRRLPAGGGGDPDDQVQLVCDGHLYRDVRVRG